MTIMLALFLPLSSFSQEDKDRDFWIDRYMSVCYPLRHMYVTSPYGLRRDPFTGEKASHTGLDLKANNESVMSMFDGIVEKTGSDPRSGKFIILRHGIYSISYCHLSKILVKEGADVLAGDVVGVTGSTGRASGPHLHITCKKGGNRVDPAILIKYISMVRNEAVEALGGSPSLVFGADCREFLEHYSEIAMEHQRLYGIPASVTLSQMAYESGFGKSELARKGNNFFGIKASRSWLASGRAYSVHDDDKPDEKFCKYDSVEESVEHHSRLLMSEKYRKCRKYKSTDYHGWLKALKKAGYATSSDYVAQCEKIIKRYKLYVYDQLALKA